MPGSGRPTVSASAGATTSANNKGASSGTSSSRGVRTMSASRRRVSVESCPRTAGRAGAPVSVVVSMSSVWVTVVIVWFLRVGSGSRGERRACELEIDVVEGGPAAGDGGDREPQRGDGRDCFLSGSGVQGDVDGRADRERVFTGDAAGAQCRHCGGHVAVDTEVEDLAAERGEQRRRAVQRDDAALVHDGDAIAELFGFVEIMSREQDGHARTSAQTGDVIEEL